MRKSIFFLMMSLMTLVFVPTQVCAATKVPVTTEINNPEAAERARVLLARLDEIKAMDKSALTHTEKKELRKEVRAIRTELRTSNSGIYLSVGAIIIIILLLILLL